MHQHHGRAAALLLPADQGAVDGRGPGLHVRSIRSGQGVVPTLPGCLLPHPSTAENDTQVALVQEVGLGVGKLKQGDRLGLPFNVAFLEGTGVLR